MSSPVRLYFAYGSNMSREQMARRCSNARPLGLGTASGFKFLINRRGVATIVPSHDKFVHGLLWELSGRDEIQLDQYEGVANGCYFKREIVTNVAEQKVSALAYVATDDAPGAPRSGYLERIVSAATELGLPAVYLEELESWSTTSG